MVIRKLLLHAYLARSIATAFIKPYYCSTDGVFPSIRPFSSNSVKIVNNCKFKSHRIRIPLDCCYIQHAPIP